jgi:hypothetical protein
MPFRSTQAIEVASSSVLVGLLVWSALPLAGVYDREAAADAKRCRR